VKIHSNTLTDADLYTAARQAGVGFTDIEARGSRSRARAWDVILTGHSSRRQNFGTDYAATWDEWGIFLGHLFTVDPEMTATYYSSADEFHWMTGDRFRTLTHAEQHKQHTWKHQGVSVTGSYTVHECKCGAITRRMLHGTFSDTIKQEFDGVI
jgi:hypothetical protein